MSFDLEGLRAAVAAHGRVARVVVADVHGSAPREVGASMLVWEGGQSGTIGGGALEFEASAQAFARHGATRHPLGPALGQCCGGAVVLWSETFEAGSLPEGPVVARGPGDKPLAVQRLMDRARARGEAPVPQFIQGWIVEPVLAPRQPLWIWGAGHVGRALVDVLAPLAFEITWVDTAPDRFPERVAQGVRVLPVADPPQAMRLAPGGAGHFILTYSHELDLQLCHAALHRRFAFCGLIGSDTKKARFASRLRALGHSDIEIDRICCPIGQKSLGKAPAAIAIGVAAQLLDRNNRESGAWTHSFALPG